MFLEKTFALRVPYTLTSIFLLLASSCALRYSLILRPKEQSGLV